MNRSRDDRNGSNESIRIVELDGRIHGPLEHRAFVDGPLNNLLNAGLPGLSCFSQAAYLRTAVELAKDRDRRAFWRHNLRPMIRGNPLGRQDWWVEDFQDAVVKAVAGA